MKTKKPLILAVAGIYFPFIAFTFYQMIKKYYTDNFYLALFGFACALGAFILTIFTFIPRSKNYKD